MSRVVMPLTVLVFFVQAAALRAQGQILDLIPANAAAALVVRNLDELKTKGDKFVADAELKVPLRPSQIFDFGFQFLGVKGGLDMKSPAAIVLVPPENGNNVGLRSLVVALPFTDLDALSASFGFEKGQLKPKRMAKGKGQNFGSFFYVRDKHLFLGDSESAVTRVIQGKPLNADLPPAQRESLNTADLLLHLGPKAMDQEWAHFLQMVRSKIGKRDESAEQKIVDQFVDSLAQLRYGLVALRIDNGLGLSFLASFSKDAPESVRKFLATLGSGKGAASLKGLPEGNLLAVQALRGDGSKSGVIAKIVFDLLLKNFLETKEVLSAVDRPVVVGVLTEIWSRLEGSRAGLYLTADEHKLGLFSLVAILDTDNAEKFLADMKTLARIADGTALDLAGAEKAEERIDVDRLVKDLGDVKFRVRESATLKLRLLGLPALPYLEKARKSADLETARRVQNLRTQILQAAALRRKDLLGQDLLRRLQPTFAMVANAEKRAGHRIDVVRIKLADKESFALPPLRQIFGPEWQNIRLAIHGRQVVFLLGSDVELLETALKSLDRGAAGLAAAKSLQPFLRTGNPARMVEFHASMEKILALTSPAAAARKERAEPGELTSFALTVDPTYMQLDVWVPSADVRVIAKKQGWW